MGDIFEYSDPIISEWRRGDSTQPFIHYQDITFQVARTAVVLNEVPVKQNRVFVKDPSNGQIFYEVENKAPESLEFRVDYSNGTIFFHESAEGKRLAFTYFGRGAQFFPASRVWTKEINGSVEQTLGELVEGASEFYFLGAYEPGMQYKIYNMVSFQGGIYICIKDTKVSPPNDEYWRQISGMMWRGTYSSQITYGAGDYVNDTEKENIYQSLVDNNVGNSLTDKSKWLLIISVSDAVKTAKAATDKANTSSANADASAANANEKALFAETQGNFAKTQGDYSKEQGDYALAQGNHAKTQGDYAGIQGKKAQGVVDNFVNKGEYSATATYLPNNVVTYNGSSYMCILESKGNPPSNNKFWKLAASKGDSINWRGDYDSSTSYKKDDAVSYLGSSYICIVDSTGKLPTETSYWGLMSAKGVDGTGAGTVTMVSSANEDIKIENSTTTPVLTLNSGTGANQILKLDSDAQITSDILKDGDKNKVFKLADKAKLDNISNELENFSPTPVIIKPGLQVVESAQDTPFQFGETHGSTRINLNGKEGNFAYRGLLPTFFGTGEIVSSSGPIGTKAMKVVCNRTDTAHFGARYELEIDRSKHYIAVAYMDNVSCDAPVYFSIAEMKDTGYTSLRLSAKIAKGSGMQYLYATTSPTQMENREKLVYYFRGEGTSGAEFRIGPFAFYEITADEYDAIANLTPEQVAEKYPYVDSMTNVKNPYAIVTGGNLLPPFYEWDTRPGDVIVGPYHLQKTATAQYQGTISPKIRVIRGQTYTLSSTRNGRMVLGEYKEDGTVIGYPIAEEKDNNGYFSQSVTIGADTDYVIVQLSNMAASGTFSFEDTMLVPDSEPKPFTPQQRSIIAFETELAAHPVDGSNPDTLFMGDDGLPYVNEMWGKVVLDGSLSYRLGTKTTAWKQVYFDISQGVIDSEIVIKFNGTRLTSNQYMDGSDQSAIDSVDKTRVYLTIANTDSGWGPDYKPELDEIKAYFLGWRMCQQETAGLYNGTGTRCWGRVTDPRNVIGAGGWDATTVLPTTPAGTDALGNVYTPYRLQYLKAKPTVEPVRNYELGATLSAGSNMVEVGSGIVIREKANPFVNYINAINAAGGRLKYRTTRLLAIYRNQARDFGWTFKDNIWNGEPYQYAEHPIPALANAVYHVTYTMLDPTLAAPINGTVAANLRGTVSDLVRAVKLLESEISVIDAPVKSVNGKTGDVVLAAADVGAETPTGAQEKASQAETNAKNASLPRSGGTLTGGLTVNGALTVQSRNILTELDSVKQSVVDGKGKVAGAINDMGGGPVSANNTFDELAAAIRSIQGASGVTGYTRDFLMHFGQSGGDDKISGRFYFNKDGNAVGLIKPSYDGYKTYNVELIEVSVAGTIVSRKTLDTVYSTRGFNGGFGIVTPDLLVYICTPGRYDSEHLRVRKHDGTLLVDEVLSGGGSGGSALNAGRIIDATIINGQIRFSTLLEITTSSFRLGIVDQNLNELFRGSGAGTFDDFTTGGRGKFIDRNTAMAYVGGGHQMIRWNGTVFTEVYGGWLTRGTHENILSAFAYRD